MFTKHLLNERLGRRKQERLQLVDKLSATNVVRTLASVLADRCKQLLHQQHVLTN